MNLLNALAEAQGGQGMQQLASQFGLSPQQTQAAVDALLPKIAGGMQGQAGGLGALIGILGGGGQAAATEAPHGSAGVSLGNEVLGQIFGSKQVSRDVAAEAAQQSGVSPDILKKMLPVLATMVMGVLAKNGGQGAGGLGGLLGALTGGTSVQPGQPQSGGLGGMLSSALDANKDGNVADDLMKMAGGFFNKR